MISNILKVIGAGLIVIGFGVSMEVPKKFLTYAGIVGMVGWIVYLFSLNISKDVVLSTFISATSITILSQLGARIYKSPVTVFLISGILPLVPGTGMYRTIYYLLNNNSAMVKYYLIETLMIAGSIALAIFIIDSLYRLITKQKRHLREIHFLFNQNNK